MKRTSILLSARRLAIGGVACAAMLALSSCAGLTDANHEKESSYAKASDTDEGTIDLQNWIPRAATDVTIRISTTAQSRPITRFVLPADQLPEDCVEVVTAPPPPQLDADWMPAGASDKATGMCGDVAVIADGSTITAWDTRKPEAG
ncbi:hypothetical protein GM708_17115 [Vibrio cholerae]|nr:hypothetical protein [Vibrio cholerae]